MEINLKDLLGPGLRIIGIVLGALLVNWIIRRALRRAIGRLREKAGLEVSNRALTLTATAASFVGYAVFFFALLMILREAGVNTAPLLAGAGIVGLAIGFGAQSLVKDIVSGFFILLEGQYGVDDTVEINGITGVVEEVGLRLTRLRDVNGQVFYFPNGSIASMDRFPTEGINYSLHIPVGDAPTEEIAKATEMILADFDAEYRAFLSAPQRQGIKTLPTYTPLLQYTLRLSPLRKVATLEKLPGRIASGLLRTGHALPEGTEISLLPAGKNQ